MTAAARADEAEDAFAAALQAEQRLAFAEAVVGYDRALQLRPSASFAHRARIRRDDLRDHAEGNFEPLVALERVRRSPPLASDPVELQRLLDAAMTFPHGRVRAEALLLVAEAFGRRLGAPERAILPAQTLAEETRFDRPLRARGLELWVGALDALRRGTEASAALRKYPGLSPSLERRHATERRRAQIERAASAVAVALLAADVVALGWLLRRAARRRALPEARGARPDPGLLWAPTTWLTAVTISLGGAAFAYLYDPSLSARPFLLLGVGVALVDRSAALWRHALGFTRAARLLSVAGGLLGVVAAALLALLHSDPAFLDSFGLLRRAEPPCPESGGLPGGLSLAQDASCAGFSRWRWRPWWPVLATRPGPERARRGQGSKERAGPGGRARERRWIRVG